eukprot:gene11301-13353_t
MVSGWESPDSPREESDAFFVPDEAVSPDVLRKPVEDALRDLENAGGGGERKPAPDSDGLSMKASKDATATLAALSGVEGSGNITSDVDTADAARTNVPPDSVGDVGDWGGNADPVLQVGNTSGDRPSAEGQAVSSVLVGGKTEASSNPGSQRKARSRESTDLKGENNEKTEPLAGDDELKPKPRRRKKAVAETGDAAKDGEGAKKKKRRRVKKVDHRQNAINGVKGKLENKDASERLQEYLAKKQRLKEFSQQKRAYGMSALALKEMRMLTPVEDSGQGSASPGKDNAEHPKKKRGGQHVHLPPIGGGGHHVHPSPPNPAKAGGSGFSSYLSQKRTSPDRSAWAPGAQVRSNVPPGYAAPGALGLDMRHAQGRSVEGSPVKLAVDEPIPESRHLKPRPSAASRAQSGRVSELELLALRGIRMREELLHKAAMCVAKLRAQVPPELDALPTTQQNWQQDLPFLWAALQERTLEVVETIMSWQTASETRRQGFLWKGEDYLVKIGADLSFLDANPHAAQFLGGQATQDPFLVPPNRLKIKWLARSEALRVQTACAALSKVSAGARESSAVQELINKSGSEGDLGRSHSPLPSFHGEWDQTGQLAPLPHLAGGGLGIRSLLLRSSRESNGSRRSNHEDLAHQRKMEEEEEEESHERHESDEEEQDRGYHFMSQEEEEERAAVLIQKQERRRQARQRVIRVRHKRMHMRQIAAAGDIQRQYRGFRGRERAEWARRERAERHRLRRETAAVSVQRHFRGFQGREQAAARRTLVSERSAESVGGRELDGSFRDLPSFCAGDSGSEKLEGTASFAAGWMPNHGVRWTIPEGTEGTAADRSTWAGTLLPAHNEDLDELTQRFPSEEQEQDEADMNWEIELVLEETLAELQAELSGDTAAGDGFHVYLSSSRGGGDVEAERLQEAAERERAATAIQAQQRGRQARREAEMRRVRQEQRRQAAVIIQSHQRGAQARHELRGLQEREHALLLQQQQEEQARHLQRVREHHRAEPSPDDWVLAAMRTAAESGREPEPDDEDDWKARLSVDAGEGEVSPARAHAELEVEAVQRGEEEEEEEEAQAMACWVILDALIDVVERLDEEQGEALSSSNDWLGHDKQYGESHTDCPGGSSRGSSRRRRWDDEAPEVGEGPLMRASARRSARSPRAHADAVSASDEGAGATEVFGVDGTALVGNPGDDVESVVMEFKSHLIGQVCQELESEATEANNTGHKNDGTSTDDDEQRQVAATTIQAHQRGRQAREEMKLRLQQGTDDDGGNEDDEGDVAARQDDGDEEA